LLKADCNATRKPSLEVAPTTSTTFNQPWILDWLLFIHSFQSRFTFQPLLAIPAVSELVFLLFILSYDLEHLPMTLTYELDQDGVRLSSSDYLVQKLVQTHRHTRPIALPGPLKWSVIICSYRYKH